HPFLKEFTEYEKLEDYGMKLYIQAEHQIEKGDVNSALSTLKILSDFSEFKDEAQQLRSDIENKIKFEEAIKSKDVASAYKYLDLLDSLQETPEGSELFEKWNRDVEKANEYASKGDIDGVKSALSEYMNIHSKHMSIASIVAWCYITQLEKAVRAKKDQAYIENGIKRYILNFGLRDEIESFYNIFVMYYKNSKLNLEMLHKGSMKMWKPSMIVDSILDED
ncbi:MAG: hypothetical protein JXQ66_05215, partial [Campylobacterales bacterium]|nr:hypothetical protein [Campylobacterales bacterium]